MNYLGAPDNGVIIGAYIGSFMMAGAYLAITCLTSALTRNQVIAFIISVVVCLLMVLGGIEPIIAFFNGIAPWLANLVSSFSFMTHFEDFQRGMVDLRHIVFFLSVIGFALFSTGVVLKSIRS